MAPRNNKRLNTKDFNTLQAPLSNMLEVYDSPIIANLQQDFIEMMQMTPTFNAPGGNGAITKEGEQYYKEKARKFEQAIEDFEAQNPDRFKEAPNLRAFEKELFRLYKMDFQNIKKGISTKQEDELASVGYYGTHGLLPNFNFNLLKDTDPFVIETSLKQYPLHEYLKKGNDLQESYMDYIQNKDDRSERENAERWADIEKKKRDFLEISNQLSEKSKEPTADTLLLFGKPDYLVGKEGFVGHRALETVINRLNDDLNVTAQKNLSDSLKKFNTSRAFIFKSESGQHKDMREATEKVQENLKKLDNPKLSDQERAKLKKETYDAIGKMNDMADAYIAHATKDGKTPNTPAGKQRLEGARELKTLAENLQKKFAAEPSVQMAISNEKEMKFREGLTGNGKEYYENEMKKFKQYDNVLKNPGVDNKDFSQLAAEMITLSAMKDMLKKGDIVADEMETQHFNSLLGMQTDHNFQSWVKENLKDAKSIERIATMTPDELRKDYVNYAAEMTTKKNAEMAAKLRDQKQAEKKNTEKVNDKTKTNDITNDKNMTNEKGNDKNKTNNVNDKKVDKKDPDKTLGQLDGPRP